MASLDLCGDWLTEEGPERIRAAAEGLKSLKQGLSERGWVFAGNEPLKLTFDAAASGRDGFALADLLRAGGVEPEYADRDHVVLMASGSTDGEAFRAVEDALHAVAPCRGASRPAPPLAKGERVMSVREALFAPRETVQAGESLGRICGAPTVSCPPAVPVAVSGERIGEEALTLFRYYGVEAVDVLKE